MISASSSWQRARSARSSSVEGDASVSVQGLAVLSIEGVDAFDQGRQLGQRVHVLDQGRLAQVGEHRVGLGVLLRVGELGDGAGAVGKQCLAQDGSGGATRLAQEDAGLGLEVPVEAAEHVIDQVVDLRRIGSVLATAAGVATQEVAQEIPVMIDRADAVRGDGRDAASGGAALDLAGGEDAAAWGKIVDGHE